MKRKLFLFFLFTSFFLVLSLIISTGVIYYYKTNNNYSYAYYTKEEIESNKVTTTTIPILTPDINVKTVTISAVGDCTIGWDTKFGYNGRFDQYYDISKDYGYYFDKVSSLFKKDDLTIINLEGVFTEERIKVIKTWNYKAPIRYRDVLVKGNVDVVSFANNHTHDYGVKGYSDTLKALDEVNILTYGYSTNYLIKKVNGIKIGFFGMLDTNANSYTPVKNAIQYFKDNNCDLIIASMHWGNMYEYIPSQNQINMGHYLIDNGVDLVIGHHPHVIEGIEKYNGKYILYSLGNFVYGGNPNPSDKDTFVWRQTFTFKDGMLQLDDNIDIIPASLSGMSNYNNYQPVLLKGNDRDRVLNKILNYSWGFSYN